MYEVLWSLCVSEAEVCLLGPACEPAVCNVCVCLLIPPCNPHDHFEENANIHSSGRVD